MYNLSDEEFDRMCREAADKPEPRIPVDGWEKMRARLDREMPQEKDRRRGWILWLPLMLFLPLALWFWKERPTSPQAPVPVTTGGPARPKETPAREQGVSANLPAARQNTTKPVNVMAGNMKTGDDASIHLPVMSGLKKQVPVTGSRMQPRVRLTEAGNTPGTSGEGDATPRTPDIRLSDSGPAPVLANIPGTDTVVTKSSAQADNAPAAKRSFRKSLAVSGVIGPDFSNVDFAAPDETGLNMGIIFEYRFSRRWSVQTGFLYSRKHYTAIGDAYKGYPGYNPSNPALDMDHVQANCFMWDFPLNIRYDFLGGRKHLAYASVGTSSYLMNREDLHYYYSYYNTPRYKQWENTSQSMYWFAAANLSLGYEYRFTPALSARMEPFLKLPLRSVGYGSVDLTSLGLLMGITYRLPGHHAKPSKQ